MNMDMNERIIKETIKLGDKIQIINAGVNNNILKGLVGTIVDTVAVEDPKTLDASFNFIVKIDEANKVALGGYYSIPTFGLYRRVNN